MKSEEAFNLIVGIVSQCKFTLQESDSVRQALQILKEAVDSSAVKEVASGKK